MTNSHSLLKEKMITALRGPVLRKAVIPPLRSYFRYFPLAKGKHFVWETIASHLWWLEAKTRATTWFGSTMNVDARDGVGRFIYYFGVWEPNLTSLLRSRLKPGDCFVDVGSNVGYFSLLGCSLVGGAGRVVSIEAIPRTFEVLSANVRENCSGNVRLLNAAVWDKEEELTFFVSRDVVDCTSTAIASLAQERGLGEQCVVAAAPLSQLLTEDEIRSARLIKIDVEGAERQAVDGLGHILEDGRPDLEIVIEVSNDAFDYVSQYFLERGFYCYHLLNDYGVEDYLRPHRERRQRPTRIEQAPSGHTYLDLIFSKIDANELSLSA